ncbi:hypothetical protein [Candidatus Clostridium stratigraminis]|uniref:YopX protein n=1 Tax=Candidatus Clostridium stratigraminis TaxID=3381661 RepID=A0ABW8T0F5_9CLOT
MKRNYSNMGLSSCMGSRLRKEVERQLLIDLQVYGIENKDFKFDWSESCIEGHAIKYLDGHVENFSGIMIFEEDEIVADGWMEFIYDKKGELFIVYWEFLDVFIDGREVVKKNRPGIPNHIIDLLPDDLKDKYSHS